MVVEGWLARAAAARPAHTAVQTPVESWSYARLHSSARAGAQELAARGVLPGERVAIALAPGTAFAQALHACLLLGVAAVPLDLRLAAAERAAIAEGATLTIDEPLAQEHAAGAAAVLPNGHDLDAVAVVIHTSGTTAAPRPVELTYANFLWSALGSAVALGLDERDRWLCALPLSHIGGLSILMRSTIYATTALVHDGFETDRVVRALGGEATLISLVATTLERLLEAGLREPPALRCALTGGGPVPASLLERAHAAGVPVSLTYGLSEACSQVTTTPLTAAPVAPASPGPPLFCTRVRVAEDGEILIAGPTLARSAPLANGWLRTGDLGALDGAGNLRVIGRRAETIISGGENVAPAEVEAVLETHPAVREAAVLGRADERWGEAVTAVVVARPGPAPTPEELRAHCAAALAPYKVPKEFRVSSEPLPRTSSGKLLRRQLA